MEEIVLRVENLETKLQVGDAFYNVVDSVSFCLEKGKTLALVGESGCGKSLTALSILRILPPAANPPTGLVKLHEESLFQFQESEMRGIRGSKIAMIFQDPTSALNPVYTIGDQISETVTLHMDVDEELAKSMVLKILKEVGVPSPEERFDEYPHQLSGGLKQRIMIAMALVCQPEILIADEPTTALDVTIQAQVLELIRLQQKKRGMAVLLITHDMGVVAEMADSVCVMYASQVIESGSVYDIFDEMGHPYTKGLFESRPHSKSSNERLKPIKGTVPSLPNYPVGCKFHPRCPYVMEKCKLTTIPFFKVAENPRHLSRCLLHDGTHESAEKLLQVGGLRAYTPA